MSDDVQKLAELCAQTMMGADKASRSMGMKLDAIEPGTATLSMVVQENMVNGHDICHGGMVFTLADSAFAFACNTYNQITVAASADISFLRPAMLGERLTACAREVWREGRNGIYDTCVTNQDGVVIAQFRGKSRTINGTLVNS